MCSRAALVALCSIAVSAPSTAAQATAPTGTASDYSLQFAVPSSPAFKLVEVGQTAILRPTSFHQFASTLGDLGNSSGSFALPKELGVEIAPFFLAKGRTLTLPQYAARAGLYRFRVSGAFRRGTGVARPTLMSLGMRFAPKDATDPRSDPTFIRRVTALDSIISRVCADMAETRPSETDEPGVVASCTDPHGREAGLVRAIAKTSSDTSRARLERELAAFRRAKGDAQSALDAANAGIKKLKDQWTETAWNRSGLELALAGATQTADTLGRNPEFRSASAWLSAAAQLGTWGQLVGGGNFSTGRDSVTTKVRQTGTAGVGLFIGSDKYKGFVESQISVKSVAKSIGAVATAGAEVYLGPGLWANATTGWNLDSGTHEGRIVSRVTLRTKFPLSTPDNGSEKSAAPR
jgi:hypothetical protein